MFSQVCHILTSVSWSTFTFPVPFSDLEMEVEYESLPTENVFVHMVAGAAAGIMEHCVMYPVDLVKVTDV